VAVDLERDWPILAAAGAGVIGLLVLTRAGREVVTQQPVVTGGTSADFQAAVQAQVQLAQARQQAAASMFGTLVGAFAQTEQTRLQTAAAIEAARLQAEIAKAQAEAQIKAAQAQAGAQTSLGLFGFLGALLPFIFKLSQETTARAALQRRLALEGARALPLQVAPTPMLARTG
jgi:multidrug efflux pump subunit AcrA (membrane-fusion protein)